MSHEMIEVFVTEDGDIIVESHGYVGQRCKMATISLERALGVPGVPQLKTEWIQETHATRQTWE